MVNNFVIFIFLFLIYLTINYNNKNYIKIIHIVYEIFLDVVKNDFHIISFYIY